MKMLLAKSAQVRWNGSTRKHYESLGYVWGGQNNWFEVHIEHLIKTTPIKVEVECDYCERIHLKEYRSYIKSREIVEKDCCGKRSCMVQKSQEVSLIVYGVKSYAETKQSKEHMREVFQTPKEDVINLAESKGITILNMEEYENDRTRLNIICAKHNHEGIQETNYANIKKNKNCCIHINKEIEKGIPRLSGEQVILDFKNEGLIPMFEADYYQSSNQPLPYKCPNHMENGIQYRRRGNLQSAEGCPFCASERTAIALRSDMSKIIKQFESKGLIILDTSDYKNKESHVRFECIHHKGYIQSVTSGGLSKTKVPCELCREENSLSKLSKKLRSSIGKWINKSKIECNNKCVLTGSESFEVHHLYSFHSIIIDALKILDIPQKDKYEPQEIIEIRKKVKELHELYDGVCLHPTLHIKFHNIYKKHHNTPVQFEEFKQRYLNGEFEDVSYK